MSTNLATDYLTELERVSAANMKVQQGLAKYSQYLSADVAMTPPTVTWTTDDVTVQVKNAGVGVARNVNITAQGY